MTLDFIPCRSRISPVPRATRPPSSHSFMHRPCWCNRRRCLTFIRKNCTFNTVSAYGQLLSYQWYSSKANGTSLVALTDIGEFGGTASANLRITSVTEPGFKRTMLSSLAIPAVPSPVRRRSCPCPLRHHTRLSLIRIKFIRRILIHCQSPQVPVWPAAIR